MNFVNSETPHDERRQNERSRLIIDVYFDGSDLTGVASTKDISAGGLYMNSQTDIPEGALLTLRIPLGNRDICRAGCEASAMRLRECPSANSCRVRRR